LASWTPRDPDDPNGSGFANEQPLRVDAPRKLGELIIEMGIVRHEYSLPCKVGPRSSELKAHGRSRVHAVVEKDVDLTNV
jgi:hypothetical protein